MSHLRDRLLSRDRSERGAILVLASVGMVVAVLAAALSVDLGRLAQDKRNDRQVADLASLDAVRRLPDPVAVQLAASLSADRNGFPCADVLPRPPGFPCMLRPAGFSVVAHPGSRGAAGFTLVPDPLLGLNAVEVTVTSRLKNQFAAGTHDVTVRAVATLGNGTGCSAPDICVQSDNSPIGTVRIGSTLAGVTSEATLLDRLLTQTVGGTYTLNAVGWQGLAAGDVSFKRLRAALGLSAGTADSVLDTTLTYRQLLDATASALHADGSASSLTAETALASIKSQVTAAAGTTLTLRKLFDISGNVGGGTDVADATINVKDIVIGGMALADSDHLASMNLTAADIPGLPGTGVTVKFGLIEAPQTKSGPAKDGTGYRTVAHTAQIRLQLLVNLPVQIIPAVTVAVTVPYYIEAGRAQGQLDTIACTVGQAVPTSVDILGVTDTGKTVLGAVSDSALSNPGATPVPATATLVDVAGLITATTNSLATVTIPGNTGTHSSPLFTPPYNTTTSRSVPGTALTLPNASGGSSGNITVTVAGLLALTSPATVATTLATAINATLSPLASSLLTPLFRALGLSFAGATMWAPPPQNCNPTSFNTNPTPTPPVAIPSLAE